MFRKRRSCYGVYDSFTTRNRRFDGFSLAFEANVKSVRSLNHVLSLNHVMRVKTFEDSSFFFFYVIQVFLEEILILISLCRNEKCSVKLIFIGVTKDLN